MSKDKKRRPYDRLFTQAVILTAQAFQCSTAYVRMAENGTAQSGRADEIKKHLRTVYQRLTSTSFTSAE